MHICHALRLQEGSPSLGPTFFRTRTKLMNLWVPGSCSWLLVASIFPVIVLAIEVKPDVSFAT